MNATKYALIVSLLLCSGKAFAQSADSDPAAIIELGAAAGQSLIGGAANFGPDFAVEVTPTDNWLEIETGVTPLFGHGSTEWDADLLFKKPWTLSDKVEFMAGAGPVWIHTSEHGVTTDAPGVEAVGDFHVLALGEAQIRLVSRTCLRLQLWTGAPAVGRYKCRSADRDRTPAQWL